MLTPKLFAFVLFLLIPGTILAQAMDPYIRIDLRYPGVYRVTGKELAEAGAPLESIRPDKLKLESAGRVVPILLNNASPEKLSDADTIEFVGDSPRGTNTWFMPENKYNVYFLTWNKDNLSTDSSPIQYQPRRAASSQASALDQTFFQWQHLEKNYQFWFSTLPPNLTDNFYWAPHTAGTPPDNFLKTYLSFPGFNASAGLPAKVNLHIYGATNAGNLQPSHLFTVLYNQKPAGEVSFDGVSLHDVDLELTATEVRKEPTLISFDTPPGREKAVDKIYLDWINVEYPSRYTAGYSELYQFNNNLLTSVTKVSTESIVIADLLPNSTIFDPVGGIAWSTGATSYTAITNNTAPTTFTAVAPYNRLKVDFLSLAQKSTADISNVPPDTQALLVYHPRLAKTAEAYKQYRRERGWKIESIDVRAIFDQTNQGYISDVSLKTYIKAVRDKATSLTHVVLLGDAYFDYREARTADDTTRLDVLIPIHWVYKPGVTWSGGYQDDNWYVSFANEFRPDLAIGRISVNSDEDGLEYLRKVIEYEVLRKGQSDPGLMISSVERAFQEYVTEIAQTYKDKLSTYTMLFPIAEAAAREVSQVREEIDRGKQLLYYVGHGGSLVWRVGPADFSRQKDLFTPSDVKKLKNRGHYPLVVCASCYTTAFDQPESIGEALVNQPRAGAIAVVGAPWKATVQESHDFNRILFKYYFDPSIRTLGEASLLAHRDHTPPDLDSALYNSFTLLGDPCLEIVR